MRALTLALFATVAATPLAAQSVDRDAVNRIIEEGTNQSEVMPIAQHLTDVIGPRLTNSPGMRQAEEWTQAKFREWGLKNVHKEGFEFGRGWSIVSSSVRMVTPRPIQLTAIPIAWTPGTNGTVTAPLSGLKRFYGWNTRWPIIKKPGYDQLAAYFNLDNGSGKIRGIYAENNPAAVPIFREWFAPFQAMGASTVAMRPTSSTDHYFFQSIGLQGFQFIQDPLDYGSRLHHTNVDTFDHLQGDDLRQASIIMASFLLNAANADKPLPKPPLPRQPKPTDPFAWPEQED